MMKNTSVCVIGAGCSGITSIKNLIQAGIKDIVCYEQNDQVGGNWIYTAKESHSSVCETTHIISSKTMSEFLDFPMPEEYPDYPSHRQVLHYFQSYANHFGLLPYIQFKTTVSQVEKVEGDKWKVILSNGTSRVFDFLLVANGHHHVPRMPKLKGDFTGEFLHSHSYKSNKAFVGKRVLVIGAGNSGCDCAVETSRVAEHVGISLRSPQYIVPKFFLGKPADTFNDGLKYLPKFLHRIILKLVLKIQVGDYRDYNLPKPDFPVTSAHPTMNSELLYKIRHGKVHPRKAIESVSGKKVTFIDGTSETYDSIIAATGYKITFPFFDKNFLDYAEAFRVPMYLRMFHPEHRSLFFIGLFQPQGAIWPISDYQAKLAANCIIGNWKLPDNLKVLAERDADYISKEFTKAQRHSIEVHYLPFLRKLQKQIPKSAPKFKETLLSANSKE